MKQMFFKFASVSVGVLLFLFSCDRISEGQAPTTSLDDSSQVDVNRSEIDCIVLDFPFLVLHDVKTTSLVRHVEVFIEEERFTEQDLESLFLAFSRKYPEEKTLLVRVKTDWAQISNSCDCVAYGESGFRVNDESFKYHSALFSRRGRNSYYDYNPTLGLGKLKRVQMNL